VTGLDEFSLIELLRQSTPAADRLALGIGDDAAAISMPGGPELLLAVDMLVEGVHFSFPEATPREVGRKALAVNLSDIAAMAARPLAAVIGVCLPRGRAAELGLELHAGLVELAGEFDVAVAGGDTTSSTGPLVISVTLCGEATGRGPVRRAGAVPGDWLMVTGCFGGSRQRHHLDFQPRVEEALALHRAAGLHAMIDVSDGLAADLWHLLEESGVGAQITAESIPIREAALHASDGRTPLAHALADGEDFELIFAVNPADGQAILDSPPTDTPLSRIGTVTDKPGCTLKMPDGRDVPLEPLGWRHPLSGP